MIGLLARYGIGYGSGGAEMIMEEVRIVQTGYFTLDKVVPSLFCDFF